MARGLNTVSLIGNIGQDPDIKTTTAGMVVANFSLAITERKKDASGEWADATEWVYITAFGRKAEIIRDYCQKGSRVYISGSIRTTSWEKDGSKHYRTQVYVNDLLLLDGKEGKGKPKEQAPQKNTNYDDDPDLPF